MTTYPLLDKINLPTDVRKLDKPQLKTLAKELREYLTHTGESFWGAFFCWLRYC